MAASPKTRFCKLFSQHSLMLSGTPRWIRTAANVGVGPSRNINLLDQLQQLEKLGRGHQPWKALRVTVEEIRAEVTSNWSSGSPSAKIGTGLILVGFATSRRRSFEIRNMC